MRTPCRAGLPVIGQPPTFHDANSPATALASSTFCPSARTPCATATLYSATRGDCMKPGAAESGIAAARTHHGAGWRWLRWGVISSCLNVRASTFLVPALRLGGALDWSTHGCASHARKAAVSSGLYPAPSAIVNRSRQMALWVMSMPAAATICMARAASVLPMTREPSSE